MDRRQGPTWPEVVVVIIVVGALLTLWLPALLGAREQSPRDSCKNKLKQIGLAIHNYAQANNVFPPGDDLYDGADLAAQSVRCLGRSGSDRSRLSGHRFSAAHLPFMDPSAGNVYKAWNHRSGVGLNAGVQSSPGPATSDIPEFYCPTRRSGLRPQDKVMMQAAWRPGGGTDYGGCVGRHVAYDTSSPSHNVLDAGATNAIVFNPNASRYQIPSDGAQSRWGIFGRVNVSTRVSDVKDGTSNTIMTGELQRIVVTNASYGGVNNLSHDGWAVGGDATGFTTGYGGPCLPINGQPSPLLNNGFFQSPGSEHPGGANLGLGDGEVKFISTTMDPNILTLMGSMADEVPGYIDEG